MVGWIPFHVNPPPAPGFPPGLGTTLLFWSGNPAPPIAFAAYAGFANWLHPKNPIGTKEYRAAIYLQGVAAEFSDDGSPPRADRTANGSFIGYTPLRLFVGGVNVAAGLPQVAQYKKGTGPRYSPTTTADPAGNWVELRYRAEFKLSWLPNLISRVLTGAWAPYAWCEIAYRFDKTGQVDVRVDGMRSQASGCTSTGRRRRATRLAGSYRSTICSRRIPPRSPASSRPWAGAASPLPVRPS